MLVLTRVKHNRSGIIIKEIASSWIFKAGTAVVDTNNPGVGYCQNIDTTVFLDSKIFFFPLDKVPAGFEGSSGCFRHSGSQEL